MSLSNRRFFCLSFAALAGCGFTPVYGPGGAAEGLRGRISVATPADEEGAALVRRLEDRLGRSSNADLLLSADIRLQESAVGFLPDGELSRFSVDGQVDWELQDASGRTVASGQERSFTSYSATSTTVATTFAQRDARRRLMVILADRIVADLISRDLT
jgi:LPS-assembly lipoprotein